MQSLLRTEEGARRVAEALVDASFASREAFSVAARAAALVVLNAVQDPSDATWRRLRRSNAALWERLGDDGFRILEACGYAPESNAPDAGHGAGELLVLKRGTPARSLAAAVRVLRAAADHPGGGQAWLRYELSLSAKSQLQAVADAAWAPGRSEAASAPRERAGEVAAAEDAAGATQAVHAKRISVWLDAGDDSVATVVALTEGLGMDLVRPWHAVDRSGGGAALVAVGGEGAGDRALLRVNGRSSGDAAEALRREKKRLGLRRIEGAVGGDRLVLRSPGTRQALAAQGISALSEASTPLVLALPVGLAVEVAEGPGDALSLVFEVRDMRRALAFWASLLGAQRADDLGLAAGVRSEEDDARELALVLGSRVDAAALRVVLVRCSAAGGRAAAQPPLSVGLEVTRWEARRLAQAASVEKFAVLSAVGSEGEEEERVWGVLEDADGHRVVLHGPPHPATASALDLLASPRPPRPEPRQSGRELARAAPPSSALPPPLSLHAATAEQRRMAALRERVSAMQWLEERGAAAQGRQSSLLGGGRLSRNSQEDARDWAREAAVLAKEAAGDALTALPGGGPLDAWKPVLRELAERGEQLLGEITAAARARAEAGRRALRAAAALRAARAVRERAENALAGSDARAAEAAEEAEEAEAEAEAAREEMQALFDSCLVVDGAGRARAGTAAYSRRARQAPAGVRDTIGAAAARCATLAAEGAALRHEADGLLAARNEMEADLEDAAEAEADAAVEDSEAAEAREAAEEEAAALSALAHELLVETREAAEDVVAGRAGGSAGLRRRGGGAGSRGEAAVPETKLGARRTVQMAPSVLGGKRVGASVQAAGAGEEEPAWVKGLEAKIERTVGLLEASVRALGEEVWEIRRHVGLPGGAGGAQVAGAGGREGAGGGNEGGVAQQSAGRGGIRDGSAPREVVEEAEQRLGAASGQMVGLEREMGSLRGKVERSPERDRLEARLRRAEGLASEARRDAREAERRLDEMRDWVAANWPAAARAAERGAERSEEEGSGEDPHRAARQMAPSARAAVPADLLWSLSDRSATPERSLSRGAEVHRGERPAPQKGFFFRESTASSSAAQQLQEARAGDQGVSPRRVASPLTPEQDELPAEGLARSPLLLSPQQSPSPLAPSPPQLRTDGAEGFRQREPRLREPGSNLVEEAKVEEAKVEEAKVEEAKGGGSRAKSSWLWTLSFWRPRWMTTRRGRRCQRWVTRTR